MTGTSDFIVHRIGTIMKPQDGNVLEAEGVLNPGAVRSRGGELFLFPRLVGKGNFSRIGIARVHFNSCGEPEDVERLGVVLEPEKDFERRTGGGGGCEDPRVSYVEPLQCYVMSYTALSDRGPRIAVATSTDLFHWERKGLLQFSAYRGKNFDGIDNKDASVFPGVVPGHDGMPALALLHRPLFSGTRPEECAEVHERRPIDRQRESIWISYAPAVGVNAQSEFPCFESHFRLASPAEPWEIVKIGGGTPPVLTPHGWLIAYHGVHKEDGHFHYAAGVMVLSVDNPHIVLYRSKRPVLSPEAQAELHGAVDGVVFPTGADRRDDIGRPDRIDLYYGMADSSIGVASLYVPENLPLRSVADRNHHGDGSGQTRENVRHVDRCEADRAVGNTIRQ